MDFIIRNISGADLEINDLGLFIEIAGEYNLKQEPSYLISQSVDLIEAINNDQIVVLREGIPLSKQESLDAIGSVNVPTDLVISSLSDLSDVEIASGLFNGQVISFNNGYWINKILTPDDLDDSTTTNKFVSQSDIDDFHDHVNKGQLDLVSDGDHDVRTDNPHGVTAAQSGAPPTSRSINTQHSLAGGGNLTTDRTLNLVNDVASPGNDKYYGTDPGGTRGFFDLPAGGAGVVNDLISVFDCCSDQQFAAEVTKSFDTVAHNSNPTIYTFSDANDEITVNDTGLFLIGFEISTAVFSGISRSESYAYLQVDTGGGYAEVYGTTQWMYNRQDTQGAETGATVFPYNVTASGTKFRVRLNQASGGSTLFTPQDSSRLWILKLK